MPLVLPTIWNLRPMPLKPASGADHLGQLHAEHMAGGDRRQRVDHIVRARHRQLERGVGHAEAAGNWSELDVFAAHIGPRARAEPQRAAGELIEIVGIAHDQRLASARAQGGEHRGDLGHLLVVALQVEDHADGGGVAHQAAVALVGLDHQQVGCAGEGIARQALRLAAPADRRR